MLRTNITPCSRWVRRRLPQRFLSSSSGGQGGRSASASATKLSIAGVEIKRRTPRLGHASINWLRHFVVPPLRTPNHQQLQHLDQHQLLHEHRVLPWALAHWRWMAQKDALGQDMFLVGAPGPTRRRLAMAYCELAGREFEMVTLTQDSTESDLKQRREIKGRTALFVDQAPVRAALEGRLLILDGIDKAERNVLVSE